MTFTDVERYAITRMENLIRGIAGCLTPDTLQHVIDDIDANQYYPVHEDLARFAGRMAVQLASLTEEI